MTDTITKKRSIVTASETCQGDSGIQEGHAQIRDVVE